MLPSGRPNPFVTASTVVHGIAVDASGQRDFLARHFSSQHAPPPRPLHPDSPRPPFPTSLSLPIPSLLTLTECPSPDPGHLLLDHPPYDGEGLQSAAVRRCHRRRWLGLRKLQAGRYVICTWYGEGVELKRCRSPNRDIRSHHQRDGQGVGRLRRNFQLTLLDTLRRL